VVYPIERLRELEANGTVGSLTKSFYSFIGYNMDPQHLVESLACELADAFEEEQADIVLAAPA
jgi:D-proline reductase (dithiol) PrdB